ncbi:RlpA-like double-psi beta-barrel-protein domain-containing protein-containing protein, partial [Infundibulicybe gibba]
AGTFYYTGLGACGKVNTNTDMIAALSYKLFDTLYPGHTGNPNFNPICGKRLRATHGGKSVTVTVVDRCADCYGMFNVDFSPVAFTQLAAESVGRIRGLQWEFI